MCGEGGNSDDNEQKGQETKTQTGEKCEVSVVCGEQAGETGGGSGRHVESTVVEVLFKHRT